MLTWQQTSFTYCQTFVYFPCSRASLPFGQFQIILQRHHHHRHHHHLFCSIYKVNKNIYSSQQTQSKTIRLARAVMSALIIGLQYVAFITFPTILCSEKTKTHIKIHIYTNTDLLLSNLDTFWWLMSTLRLLYEDIVKTASLELSHLQIG